MTKSLVFTGCTQGTLATYLHFINQHFPFPSCREKGHSICELVLCGSANSKQLQISEDKKLHLKFLLACSKISTALPTTESHRRRRHQPATVALVPRRQSCPRRGGTESRLIGNLFQIRLRSSTLRSPKDRMRASLTLILEVPYITKLNCERG